MMIKIILALALILPAGAASTDDEIIKNLDFFQSMEMLKEEVTFIQATVKDSQDEKSPKAPEKK
jgi:hypothetical protein